jgi:acyl-CoA synthetase (NDP forming)
VAGLRELGVAYFPSCERVVRALAAVARRRRMPEKRLAPPRIGAMLVGEPGGVVPEYRAKNLLAPLGIPFPEGRLATNLEEATAAAEALGYPVALKAQSPDLLRKSDAGGVVVGLADGAELAEGWAKLAAHIALNRPGLVLDGVLVERMGARGLELIVGGRNDPDWGPLVLVGLGGVQAEVLKDVCLLPPDMSEEEIAAEISSLKGAALLGSFRNAPALDVAAVVRIVAAIGRALVSEPRIREIDLNPVIVYPTGAVALDALMLVAPPEKTEA